MEYVLAIIAYSAVIAAIVIFCRGIADPQGCDRDCKNGDYRDDEWTFK
jgi:hypothetical protein